MAGREVVAIVKDVLSILGKPTMESMIWQLDQKGVSFAPSSFDMDKFEKELKSLFGEGSNIFLKLISEKLNKRQAIAFGDTDEAPTVEKIRKLLE